MSRKLISGILIIFLLQHMILGQPATYSVKKAPFSSDEYDEFSPVYYKHGIVFCTNRKLNLVYNYLNSQNKAQFKINYVDTTENVTWQNSRLFSKELTSKFNDGPVSFSRTFDTIYFSRNLRSDSKLKDLTGLRDKLGIFIAVFDGKTWGKIREFRNNNEWYNITTPWISPDGKRLYFASDKPDGYGGSDLYYSQWSDGYWNEPVNLGPVINTTGNEAYPFINQAGELFFSSDGHPGLGGKDIFFSRFSEGAWQTPVHLDPPINSKYDDFGIITDLLMSEGYFSSNRDKSIDIFQFRTIVPQIFYRTIQKENQYCFMFSDSGAIVADTLNLRYIWDFGDGNKASGSIVSHCFLGQGIYNVRLDIIDRSSGLLFFSKLTYSLELRDIEQPYINSYDVSIKGDSIDFDGLKSHLPGYKILNFSWDFGDGTRSQGEKVKHTFKDDGEYMVNLELTLRSDSTGNIRKTGSSKKILVLNNLQEISTYLAKNSASKPDLQDITRYKNAFIQPVYSAEAEFKKEAVFQVELLSSLTKIDIKSSIFSKVPKKYVVKEIYDNITGIYSYIVDPQMNLMDTYIAYREISDAGFKNARTKIEVLKDPAARELNNIKKIFGTSTDSYFDSYNRLTSNAYLLLDQIIKILNKYPEARLEIAVHTDNTGSPEEKLYLSEKYAQTIKSYLIDKGMDSNRLSGRGFGGTKPIAPNALPKDRVLNRRIDLNIISE
jgi:outer membrane protein OmpA-like peptidoglycan-associated protein